MKRSVVLGVAVVAAVVLAGCTPSRVPVVEGPTMIATPTIVGATVSDSPLEVDEWVIAARAADLGYVLASNNADFSISQFTSTHSENATAGRFYDWRGSHADTGEAAFVYPGPSVMQVVSVVSDGPDSATVTFCDGSDYWIEGAPALTDGRPRAFYMARDGSTILFSSSSISFTVCDASGAPVGRFDPVPTELGVLTKADVRAPLSLD
ncbi:hypothetical protein [Salinibacterium sp.]|uniref:hypothetical protein n=1 Tax=Salinibacterium sp. TaxID=1915057 RepID=UPI00286AE39B|nr:hypothetical protein [Salinibacterium sp.]